MKLRAYLNSLPDGGVQAFAGRLGISHIYLLQLAAKQGGRQPKPELCVRIEQESEGEVNRMELRDDAVRIWPELDRRKVKVA